ncbi:MAG: ATP-binding protein [Pseudomonadales bacterium]|nr:ATP-binding protein [Pseudomonadales bacterium]
MQLSTYDATFPINLQNRSYNKAMKKTGHQNPDELALQPLGALKDNLKHILLVRCVLVVALFCSLYYCYAIAGVSLNYTLLVSMLLVFSLLTTLSFFRLVLKIPVQQNEYLAQLLLDSFFISVLLYFSGGPSNPFVSYYLVPITISAATLRWFHTSLITFISLCAYSFLLFYHQSIPEFSPGHHNGGNSKTLSLHIIGMWVNFVVSAGLITVFVVKMAEALRLREQHINKAREDQLRDEQIMAVATLAAGTAHELGTPLSSILMLVDELIADNADNPAALKDLHLIKTEIGRCKNSLKKLVSTAENHHQENLPQTTLSHFLEGIFEHWLIIRPDVSSRITINLGAYSTQLIYAPQTIEQSVINLLNNAADANPNDIDIVASIDDQTLVISIKDNGPGIDDELANNLGTGFISTKEEGLGLGLMLTYASITRFGGSVKLRNRSSRGTLTEIRIPLEVITQP